MREQSSTPQTKSSRRSGRSCRCNYLAFTRACATIKIGELEALEAAGVGGNSKRSRNAYLAKLRKGVSVDKSSFKKLAKVLRCESTYLHFIPESELPRWESPPYKFAIRVAELLEDEKNGIPLIDPDTGDAPDVVRYLWEMGDPVLDSISLTSEEKRKAFMILRDYLMVVTERSTETERKHPRQLGVMVRGSIPKDDIISDIRAREMMSLSAFDDLQRAYNSDNPFHINRIRELIPGRYKLYLEAVASDDEQWQCLSQSKSDPQNRKWTLAAKQISMNLIDNVIEADFHIRKVIFPTYQQDVAFSAVYSRSRQLIEWVSLRSPSNFATWWNHFRELNTEELRRFKESWEPREFDDEPQWSEMRNALKMNLRRTIKQIQQFYPD